MRTPTAAGDADADAERGPRCRRRRKCYNVIDGEEQEPHSSKQN
jgi:hypothetical protein